MNQSTDDHKQIRMVQSSTRGLMTTFRDKTESLTKCSSECRKMTR